MKEHGMTMQHNEYRNDNVRNVNLFSGTAPAILLGTILPFIPAAALATDLYWVCGNGFEWDSYPTSYCWATTAGGVATVQYPVSSDTVYLTQSGTTDISVEYFDPAPEATLTNLYIDATGTGTMTLSQINSAYSHNLYTNSEIVGHIGTGHVILSAGTHTVANTLVLGNNITGNGSISVSNGALLASSGLDVGYLGAGTLSIASGGLVSSMNGSLGASIGSGTATVADIGSTWSNSASLTVGQSGTAY